MLFFTNFDSCITPPYDMSAYIKTHISEPSNSEPIQIAKNKMDMVYNGKNSFLIKVKNIALEDLGQAKPVIICNVDDNYQTISMKTSTERMLINQTKKFEGIVNINEKENSFLKLGFIYPCKIYMYNGGLEVNSIKPKLFFVGVNI